MTDRRIGYALALGLLAATLGAACTPDKPDRGAAQTEAALLSGTALFVTGSASLTAADTAVRNRLQGLGLTVVVKSASAAVTADATGKALVVVSSTVSPTNVGSKFTAVTVPLLTWESQIFDDLGLVPTASSNFGTQSSQTALAITTPSHPMAAGLSGTPVLTTASSTFNWGKPAAGAVRVAQLSSDATRIAIFGYDAGATLASGVAAPARRVGFFLGDTTATVLNTSGWALFDQAVTWATSATSAGGGVKVSVSNLDDFMFATVRGVRRKVWKLPMADSQLDITSWFSSGANDVRLQAVNTGGPASYSVQLNVDGTLAVDQTCASAPCTTGTAPGEGILFDQTFQLQPAGRPAAQTVTVNGTAGGKLYLNDVYTGRTLPTSLTLPPGSYTLGAGLSQDLPPDSYTGRYFEQVVTVASAPVTVNLTQGTQLPFQNTTRVAILPIRQTIHGAGGASDTGILLDSDITEMKNQAENTRRGYVEPFSYGLTTWKVDVLPTIENVALHRAADSGSVPDTETLLNQTGLQSLKQSYEIIVYLYSITNADGSGVTDGPCCFWGAGQQIWFMNLFTRGGWPAGAPNYYLLHESLHDYESFNYDRLNLYNGIAGTHGSGPHGFVNNGNGEQDFVNYYRLFVRGQIAELDGMRNGIDWAAGVPATGDLYVGLFAPFRRGVNWQAAAAVAAVPSVATAATLAAPAVTGPATSAPIACPLPAGLVR